MHLAYRLVLALLGAAMFVGVMSEATVSRTAIETLMPGDDPTGEADQFFHLSDDEKAAIMSQFGTPAAHAMDLVKETRSWQRSIYINIVCVGLNRDGAFEFSMDSDAFLKHLQAFPRVHTVGVLNTESGEESHTVAIKTRYHFTVTHADSSVIRDIEKIVKGAAGYGNGLVDAARVEDVLDIQYEKHSSAVSYVLFLLNPNLASADSDNNALESYGYIATGSSTDERGCGSSVGVSRSKRYAWIDLAAGPSTYGPQTVGDGVVTELSIPRLEYYSGEEISTFIVDLSTTIYTTCDFLFNPSMDHFPITYNRDVTIELVLMEDDPGTHGQEPDPLSTFNWGAIQRELASMNLIGQRLSFQLTKYKLTEKDCSDCLGAFVRGWKAHSRVIETAAGMKSRVIDHLDSTLLHSHLRRVGNNIVKSGKLDPSDSVSTVFKRKLPRNQVTIPIFLFHLHRSDMVLLDRYHQAVSYHDMVIAVQTNAKSIMLDYECNASPVTVHGNDATRPALAGLLQSVWGVAPTSKRWNHVRKRVEENYMWEIGHTPFGPFSKSDRLSFSQRDSAFRNILYTMVNESVSMVHESLRHFRGYHVALGDAIIDAEDLDTFHTRLAVLRYKLDRARSTMALHHYNTSLYYARSARFDAIDIKDTLNEAIVQMKSVLNCHLSQPDEPLSLWLGRFLLIASMVGFYGLVVFRIVAHFYTVPILKFFRKRNWTPPSFLVERASAKVD